MGSVILLLFLLYLSAGAHANPDSTKANDHQEGMEDGNRGFYLTAAEAF